MIELIQFPWSPFCLVQQRILKFAQVRFKTTNIPNGDRAKVWKLTKHRYYQVPILKDGSTVVFEVDDDSQVIAKYLDDKLGLGLFPRELDGIQTLIWRCIEQDVEGPAFRLNDIYWKEFVPASDQLRFLRHKERKFGRGCLDQWRRERRHWLERLETALLPFEEMLMYRDYLLDSRPRFVDFDLAGTLENFLYSGYHTLPSRHTRIREWHARLKRARISRFAS